MPELKSRITGIVHIADSMVTDWCSVPGGLAIASRFRLPDDRFINESNSRATVAASTRRLADELDKLYRDQVVAMNQ